MKTPYVLARNEVEQTLVHIWEQVLDVRPIGIHDNFFDLGGHSLAATRIVSRVIKQCQLEIPLRSLLESPTIADMAAVIAWINWNHLSDEDAKRLVGEIDSTITEK